MALLWSEAVYPWSPVGKKYLRNKDQHSKLVPLHLPDDKHISHDIDGLKK